MTKEKKLSFVSTEASDDWMAYGRLKASKDPEDKKEAARMDKSKMVSIPVKKSK